jgi:hypothetical protein
MEKMARKSDTPNVFAAGDVVKDLADKLLKYPMLLMDCVRFL